jgi:hypothetical protein
MSVTSQFFTWGVETTSTRMGTTSSYSSGYSASDLPHTGALYAAVLDLIVAGFAASVLAGAIALASFPSARRLSLLTALISVIVVAAAALVLAALQPGVVCSDAKGFSPPFGNPDTAGSPGGCTWEFYLGSYWYSSGQADGPQVSFSGHNGSLMWGPGVGWFAAVGATLVL